MNWKILWVALTLAVETIQANPFFAMDTAVRDLNELDTIKSLGYDGIGWKTGSPEEVTAAVAQVRQRGLKLFAVYSYQSAVLTATGLVLDEGSYDTGRLLRTLQELHYSGPIGLQGYNVKLPVKDNLTRSMSAWHRLNPPSGTNDSGNTPQQKQP